MISRLLDGRYKILQVLGAGGFTETYLAQDTRRLGSPTCVVKRLKPSTKNLNSLETSHRLFQSEAETLERLGNHSQIPRLLAYFEEDQKFYLVQEYIKGNLLSTEFTPEKPYSEAQTIQLLRDVLLTLAFVHKQGAIHQDIQPKHLIRRQEDGKLVLVDFGAVKKIWNRNAAQNQGTEAITSGYMATEQSCGLSRPIGDIYALGMVAIHAITGITPMSLQEDSETNEILWHAVAKASPELVAVIDKMIHYDFRDRFQSAKEVLAALDQLTNAAHGFMPNLNTKQPVVEVVEEEEETTFAHGKETFYNRLAQPHFWEASEEFARQRRAISKQEDLDPTPMTLDVEVIDKREVVDSQKPVRKKIPTRIGIGALAALGIVSGLIGFLSQIQTSPTTVAQLSSKFKPDSTAALNNHGAAFQPQGELAEVLKEYEQALQVKPNLAGILANRGLALQHQGKSLEAVQDYSQALFSLNAVFAEALYNRGLTFQSQGKLAEAVKNYSQAISLWPDDVDVFYNRGTALYAQGKLLEAIQDYNQTISLKPSFAEAFYNRGLAFQAQGSLLKAVKDYSRAISLNPNFAEAFYNRGVALQAQGNLLEAVKDYDRATQINPNLAEALYNIGIALKAQGKPVGGETTQIKSEDDRYNTNLILKAQGAPVGADQANDGDPQIKSGDANSLKKAREQ